MDFINEQQCTTREHAISFGRFQHRPNVFDATVDRAYAVKWSI